MPSTYLSERIICKDLGSNQSYRNYLIEVWPSWLQFWKRHLKCTLIRCYQLYHLEYLRLKCWIYRLWLRSVLLDSRGTQYQLFSVLKIQSICNFVVVIPMICTCGWTIVNKSLDGLVIPPANAYDWSMFDFHIEQTSQLLCEITQ